MIEAHATARFVRTSAPGALLAGGYLASGSLLPAMAAHTLLDILAGIVLVVALFQRPPESTGDVDGLRLRRSRVQAALLRGLLGTVAATLDSGIPVTRLGVPWGSLAAVIVGRGIGALRRRPQ